MALLNTRAIILAGGQGTRLKPYTTLFPKALVPLEEMPVLELVIRQLKGHGFTELTLAVGHLSELIEAYFGDGRKWGVNITYAREEKPLGTAGPLKAMADLPEDFLVMNADIVSDINYRELFEFHCREQARLASIAVYRRTSKIDFGVLEFDGESHLINNFIEKPILEHSVSMGIYVFNRRVLEFIPEDTFFGFDQLMRTLIQQEQPIRAFPVNGYWLDIGRVDDYETAVNDFQKLRPLLLPQECPSEAFVMPQEAVLP
jgi:NDP-sugar pyrophosphorylase family protein